MVEGTSEFDLLKGCSSEQLFHLQNGLDISSVRELATELRKMSEEKFSGHLSDGRNDFASWIADVFGDAVLADRIRPMSDKSEIADAIEQRVVELEERELERFGLHIPTSDLKPLEDFIERKLQEGCSEKDIREQLLYKGWKRRLINLVFVGKQNPFKEYADVRSLKDIERFHQVLERLKFHIINGIIAGQSVDEIKSFLHRQGWHQELIEFVFFDVFKPHPNIRKLSCYIVHQVRDKNRDVEEVREHLTHIGWKDYVVDSVIYGINDPDNSLSKILSYLEDFEDDDQQIKTFLLQMGWGESDVNEALRIRELEEVQRSLQQSLNLEGGVLLKEKGQVLKRTIITVDTKDDGVRGVWKHLLKDARKVPLSSFDLDDGELHIDDQYKYFFARSDIDFVERLDGKKVNDVFFFGQDKPLLIDAKQAYIVLPQIIRRRCVVSNKLFPITKMKRIEMWDETRTHKVIKYVSLQHEKELSNFLEQTRIVQA